MSGLMVTAGVSLCKAKVICMIQCRLQRADMGGTLGTGHHVAVDIAHRTVCRSDVIGRYKALFGQWLYHLIRTTELTVIPRIWRRSRRRNSFPKAALYAWIMS